MLRPPIVLSTARWVEIDVDEVAAGTRITLIGGECRLRAAPLIYSDA
jgi:hypothetical protein